MRFPLILILVCWSALTSAAADLTVFAAASLSDAMKEIGRGFESSTGDTLHFNFGASSALALQIKNGVPADLFFSADEAKMNDLARNGLVLADTRRALLSNTLVIVVNADGGAEVSAAADLAGSKIRVLALAETQTVPAGIYAKQYLQKLGLWEKVSGKVVPTESVRACLAAVEVGNADAGIVYKTDALISKKVRIAYEVAAADGPAISYPLAVVKGTRDPDRARALAAYFEADGAKKIFIKYGFLMAP